MKIVVVAVLAKHKSLVTIIMIIIIHCLFGRIGKGLTWVLTIHR